MKLVTPIRRAFARKPVAVVTKPCLKQYAVVLPDELHQIMDQFLWLALEERALFPNRPLPDLVMDDDEVAYYVSECIRAQQRFHRAEGFSLAKLLTLSSALSAGAGNVVGTKVELDRLCEWAEHLQNYLALAPHLFNLPQPGGWYAPYALIDQLLGEFILAVDSLEQSIFPLHELTLTHKTNR